MVKRIACIFLSFLMIVLLTACGENSTENTPANTETNAEKVKIRVGNIYNQTTTYGKALDKFKEDVEKNSNGQIEVEIFHNSSLGSEKDHIEAVKTGSLEMMESGTAGIGLYIPETAIFELWYSYKDLNQLIEAFESLQPELEKIYLEKGFKLLGAYYDGPRTILSTKRFDTLDGIKGLKFRVPGSTLYVNMANALGAKAITLPLGDVYTGLETGAIDAMEGTPDSILQAKFYEKAKYLILDNHVYQPLSIVYNKDAWEKLSDDHKKLIEQAIKDSSEYHLSLVNESNNKAIEELKKHGVEVVEVKDIEKWREAVMEESIKFAKEYGQTGDMIYNKVQEVTVN